MHTRNEHGYTRDEHGYTRNDPVAIEIKTHEHVRPIGHGTTYPPGATTYPNTR